MTATWGGAKLCDALQLVGIEYNTKMTLSGGKHVEFISVDQCKVSLDHFQLKVLVIFLICIC